MNVIPFPRPKPEPEPHRQVAEFVLDEDHNCGLTLALVDAITGQPAAVLQYKLVEVTPGFDLDRLREHWCTLREATAG